MELSSQIMAITTRFERGEVLLALITIRTDQTKEVPEIISATVETDETYLGGPWKNKRDSHVITNQTNRE